MEEVRVGLTALSHRLAAEVASGILPQRGSVTDCDQSDLKIGRSVRFYCFRCFHRFNFFCLGGSFADTTWTAGLKSLALVSVNQLLDLFSRFIDYWTVYKALSLTGAVINWDVSCATGQDHETVGTFCAQKSGRHLRPGTEGKDFSC